MGKFCDLLNGNFMNIWSWVGWSCDLVFRSWFVFFIVDGVAYAVFLIVLFYVQQRLLSVLVNCHGKFHLWMY